jgi:class 3 adenylate cyclase/tetratricopeptide (TPR) repeat protein
MHCPKCGTDNPVANKFCAECGAALSRRGCPQCGAESAPATKFCGACGSSLDASISSPASENPPVQSPEVMGERRHLTILFCDLVGSVALAAQVDPEEWRATVADYQHAASEAITRFGGEIVRYVGDGIMAFFGYPVAHDNDAERGVRAGLAILDAIRLLNGQTGQTQLAVRVGIDSGRVVVGTGTGQAVDAFGDAANIAARVQAAAESGTLMISDATQRLVSGLFIVEDRGAQALKGIALPVQLYRVIRPSGMHGRFEAMSAARGLTPFVGRDDELRSLQSRWERTLEGEGQVALISGEAGIGKSRLVQRFHEQIAGTPHTWLETAAGAFFQNTPFYPISEMLRQFVGDAAAPDQIVALAPRLTAAGLEPTEALPLIAPLLNLRLPPEYAPSPLSPEQQRRRLLATLVEWVLGSARVQPLVSVIEDLHWIDPSTLELIEVLVEQGTTARLLLLYTARPEFRVPWATRAHHTQMTLSRLSARHVRAMVGEVAAQKALSEATIATVVDRTSGVPLFIEELTRAVLESGAGKFSEREIPATLHDSLMARLDRLGPAKAVIQVCAVLGSEFSYELLHAVHPVAEADLQSALRILTDAELLYIRGIAPEATYQFKHALIRDTAYEALLKSRRKELHLHVARAIDEKFPLMKETHPEVLARHWTEAGVIEPAIAEWSRAATAAAARNAFIEARESLQQALTLLNLVPESRERDVRELKLRQTLHSMIHVTRGWAAPEAAATAERIELLARKSGDLRRLVGSMTGRCFQALIVGALSNAAALADEALELARREGNSLALAFLHLQQVMVHFYRGDLAGAEEYFTTGRKFFDGLVLKKNPVGNAIAVFGHASWTAWMLGRADVARERLVNMRLVVNSANSHDLAWADLYEARLHVLMREQEAAETLAAHALELCEKHGFPSDAAESRCALGHARAQLGRAAEGITLIRQGIDTWIGVGQRLTVPHFITSLATAQLHADAVGDALETIEQALNFNPEELAWRPETLRIRGEVRLHQADLRLAEADFRDAMTLARSMGAKAWELRATTSLARLLAQQNRRDEARAMLTEIYNWFTEGFDTADLKDARALLDELGR